MKALVALTEGQIGTIRAALRTMAEESGLGGNIAKQIGDTQRAMNQAIELSPSQWKGIQTGMGLTLEAGDDQDYVGTFGSMQAANAARRGMEKLERLLGRAS